MNLIKFRKYWYIISLLVILPGLVSLCARSLNLGIDFTGGSLIEVKFDIPVKTDDIRAVLADQKLADSSKVQTSTNNTVLIRTHELDQAESDNLIKGLQQKFGKLDLLRNEKVDPVISNELKKKAGWALLVAVASMLVYIGIRFDFYSGLAAIIAIIHDILVTVGLASLFWLEIDSASIAAILTIIGFSVHDTIVIFDRIRENLKYRKKGEPMEELIHHSIMQTLTRSINTVMTLVIPLLALIFFGGGTIRSFMIVLLIGVISGAYSSIFNASPLWFDFKRLKGEVEAS